MANKFNEYDAASWLLDEGFEEEEESAVEETEDVDPDEETEENEKETEETEETDDAKSEEDIVDAEDVAPDADDIAGRLDVIEDKLDNIAAGEAKEPDENETYELDLSNPVCPCCGARLNIQYDTADGDSDDIDNEIIDQTYGEGGDESDVESEADDTVGEEITTMDDRLDTTNDLDNGTGEDYINLDDIVSQVTSDDEEDED